MKNPKPTLVGYEFRARGEVVERFVPYDPNKVVEGVHIDIYDTKALASVARGRDCTLVPIYKRG